MDWLQSLLQFLYQFWPIRKIHPWQRGLKITYHFKDVQFLWELPPWQVVEPDSTIEYLESGLYWFTPLHQEIRIENVKPQVMDLLPQTITLKNTDQVSFSVNIEYEIEDVEANILNVHLFKFSMEAASRVHLARRIRKLDSLVALLANQDDIERGLRRTLRDKAKRWGVKVHDVGMTDLSSSRTIRLLGDAHAVAQVAVKEEYE
jgi:regulator of protease activity HflC (stomatin/prohibitin superfamily)